jgi:hypothetical protein
MTPQLTLIQLWTLLAGGPIAMVLTVLVGILVNNSITKAHINRLEIKIDRLERVLISEMKRVEGVLVGKIEGLGTRVKASKTRSVHRW